VDRSRPLSERHGSFAVAERHDGGVPPHIPTVCDRATRRHWTVVANQPGLAAHRADCRERITCLATIAGGTFEVPDAHGSSEECDADGVVMASGSAAAAPLGAVGDEPCSDCMTRFAVFSPKPGSAAIASGEAVRTPSRLPKAAS